MPQERDPGAITEVLATAYRIEDLILDVRRERVTRGNEEIALAKLSFDLLAILVRCAPDLVSVDALMAQAWPGLVVSPALAQPSGKEAAVAALRRLEAGLRTEDFGQINSKRLVMWYTTLDDLDCAYDAADRALERFALSGMVETAWGILWIEEMRAFRRDARFQAFVERLGLVEYWRQYGPADNCELRNGRLSCP